MPINVTIPAGERQTYRNKPCMWEASPELAAQLVDPMDGWRLTAGSGKKALWTCDKGHEWDAVVDSRSSGNGCPYCAGRRATPETCLAIINPELAAQLVDGSLGIKLTRSSNKKVSWKCSEGHVWDANVSDRTLGNGCPCCSGKKVCSDNCLATVNPELAKQLVDQSLATQLTAGSGRKVSWKCSGGHEWEAVVGTRSKGNDCPTCAESSRMNKWGRELCEELGLTFKTEWKHDGVRDALPLPYDIAIGVTEDNGTPSLLLEFDGQQHSSWKKQRSETDAEKKAKFSDRINKDGIKTRWAWKNKIKLVRILYHHRDCKDGDYNAGEFFRQSLLTELLTAGIINYATFSEHSKSYEFDQPSNAIFYSRSK